MRFSRRRLLEAGTTTALATLARPALAAGPAWETQWSALLGAAKKEGRLSVLSVTGSGFRKWMDAIETAFPGISIDLQQQPNSDLIANKVIAERVAGVYSFDLIVMTPVTALPRLKPVGALDRLRPLLFRPDVVNDKAWMDGFGAWGDNEKSYGFPLSDSLVMPSINTDLVGEKELKNARSLLDPKWKGKIVLSDIRSGVTRALMTSIRLRDGDDAVRRLMIDQNPTFVQDARQEAEGLVRGTFAIAQGLTPPNLQEFVDAGLAHNVKFVDVPDAAFITHTFTLWAANRAPHPNAAKLFANWFLTKEGQRLFSTTVGLNARRTDVPVLDPSALPRPGQHYFYSSIESSFPELEKTRVLMTKITGLPA